MRARLVVRALARGVMTAVLAPLAGCSVLSPWPTLELVKVVGSATQVAALQVGASSSNTVYHLHAKPRQVCIEFNPGVPVEDLLPALQNELKGHAVQSRVLAAGTDSAACSHWLRYAASVAWDHKPFDDRMSRYIAHAVLSLSQSDGRVLSTSEYQVGDGWWTGKWAGTRDKLAPVVTALLTGFES